MTELVSPHDVPVSSEPHWRDVYAQAERLEQEGQIEPVLLRADGTPDPDSWAHADAQVMAARYLEWPTILITRKDTSS